MCDNYMFNAANLLITVCLSLYGHYGERHQPVSEMGDGIGAYLEQLGYK